ncbi:MAG: hypothetical protein NZ578_10615, partial [Candidatus Binatia bacterium]|nr:hypothetical protein [Candidatus Binatia bacterium]
MADTVQQPQALVKEPGYLASSQEKCYILGLMGSGSAVKIPVLTYHSQNICGNTYGTNDHVALYQDLRTIHAHGYQVIPLQWVVDWLLGHRSTLPSSRVIAITFDDGTDFDYYDLLHPRHG